MHPTNLTESCFPFPVKISHHYNTGHIYILPTSNLKPFTEDQENVIKDFLAPLGIGVIKNRVKNNFTTKPINNGYGFRVYQNTITES